MLENRVSLDEGSRSQNHQLHPISGMLGVGMQNLLESLHLLGPLCANGAHCKSGQPHPHQGCLGSRRKTSYRVCNRWSLCVVTGLTTKVAKCNPIKDTWVRGAKPPGNLHPMGFLCGNLSRSKSGEMQPYQGCLGSRWPNLLQSLHPMGPVYSQGGRGRVRKPIDSYSRGFFFSTPHQRSVGSG